MTLHALHGGLRLPGHKAESSSEPVRPCPLPPEIVLPLRLPGGELAAPQVVPGQRVRTGERITAASGPRGVPLHASATGTVVAIEERPVADAWGARAPCVVIATATPEDTLRMPPLPADAAPDALRLRLRDAGLLGLGGAAFPTAEKLAHPRRLLILNGAECEPWIACDDRLLRERADEVVAGARLLARAATAETLVIAVEDAMREAHAALAAALADAGGDGGIALVAVPTVYPQGGERQLIRVITGQEVPSGGLPRDLGIVVQNVGTAAAAWRAVAHGEPLIERLVSATGPGIVRPGTFAVRFGTPVAAVVEAAGGYRPEAARLVLGGPMMGTAVPHDAVPVTATTNAILVLRAADVRDTAPEMPCIRCGECARVCPAQLLPQQLHWYLRARDWDQVRAHALADCIECGCCAFVCPSHIPLVDAYRWGKSELRLQERQRTLAERAKARHEARAARLARLEAERAERLRQRTESALGGAEDPVQAALARARAKARGGAPP